MTYLLTIVFVIYEQLLFKGIAFEFSGDISWIYHILFSVLPATLIVVICNLFKEKTNKILMYTLTTFICTLTAAEYVYYCIYSAPFSTYSLTQGGMGQAFSFIPQILKTMWFNMDFLLFFLPVICLIILFKTKKINLDSTKKDLLLYLGVGFLVFGGTLLCVNLDNKSVDSSSEIYYSSDNLSLRSNKFGLYTGMFLDIKDVALGSEKERLNLYGIENSNDNSLKDEITTYISSAQNTEKNEYTGIFEGKNLILIMGESFSPYAIRKNLTPTLYKLANEGFNFTNFYSPLFPVSTSDGEYMALTGLIPSSNIWSLTSLAEKNIQDTLAYKLKDKNYITSAYHNHSKEYYFRYKALPRLGFDTFTACPDLDIDCQKWPESDLEMIEKTTSNYINTKNFFTYYESVSGHLQYSESNAMVVKNGKYTKDLNYTDTVKNYLAGQIELDRALEKLISTLKDAEKLDDTVIALYSDHYPYGLTLDELSELAGTEITNNFDRDKGSFIIWNSKTKGREVKTLASSIDILPTLSNMFNLSLDSRHIIGRDIFANTEKIVIFSDQSFITDKVIFNNLTNTYISLGKQKFSASEVESLKESVSNKFKVSNAILQTNYFIEENN